MKSFLFIFFLKKGNPEDLQWEKVDMNTKNFDNLFPIETAGTIENN